MDTIPNPGRLPRWVNEPADWYTDRRPAWLEVVHAARQAVFRRALHTHPADDTAAVARTVDDLVGVILMWRFVQHRSGELPLAPLGGNQAAQDVCGQLHERLSSPLLRSVFRPAAISAQPSLLLDSAVAADAAARLQSRRFPVTAFGDYHQLCLARPLHGTAGANERRSRGVHFTPAPLVDYLTDTTLRGLAHPGGTLRVLDPSCGCGVFLIAAARFLGERLLTATGSDRVQQLLEVIAESIFGIDVNPRAVEWARRCLLLSVWEGDPDGDHSRLRVPELSRNLVTADFLAESRPAGFPDHFDTVLGGPPFVRYSQLKKDCPHNLLEWRKRFVTARGGQFDLYMPFFEQAVRNLTPGGRLGWSVSNTFLRSKFGEPLRRFLGETCTVRELVEFENPKIYADAVTQIALVRAEKGSVHEPCRHVWIRGRPELRDALDAVSGGLIRNRVGLDIRHLPATACRGSEWRLTVDADRATAAQGTAPTLKELGLRITQGVVTGADPVFLLRVVHADPSGLARVQVREGQQHLVESALLRPAIRSREVHGYAVPLGKSHLLVPYDAEGHVLTEQALAARFPVAHGYLLKRRDEIPVRGKGNRPFYAFRNDTIFRRPAIPRILAGMVTSGADVTMTDTDTAVPHAGVLVLDNFPVSLDPHYLLGVLNGPVFWAFVRGTMPTMGVGRHVLRRGPLARFRVPLPLRSAQDEIAALVRQLLATASEIERIRLKGLIDEAVLSCSGVEAGIM